VEVHDQYTAITPSSHNLAAYKIFTTSGFNKKKNEKIMHAISGFP